MDYILTPVSEGTSVTRVRWRQVGNMRYVKSAVRMVEKRRGECKVWSDALDTVNWERDHRHRISQQSAKHNLHTTMWFRTYITSSAHQNLARRNKYCAYQLPVVPIQL